MLWLSENAVKELQFLLNVIYDYNGHYIFSTIAMSHVVELTEIAKTVAEIQASNTDISNLFVSDASATHAFVYRADGSFDFVKDYEFSSNEKQYSSGHRELLAVQKVLISNKDYFKNLGPQKIFWQTDSKNCYNFLLKGSRVPAIQTAVFEVKVLEKELNIIVLPVWTPRSQDRLVLADAGSKFSTSTDEWCVSRADLLNIFSDMQFWPTVDGFASGHNKICDKFFAALPQTGASGVNFFAQPLLSDEKYFCCPPVRLITACYRKLVDTPGVEAVLLVPEWKSAAFWPFLFNGKNWRSKIVDVIYFPPHFFFSNRAISTVFTGAPNFRMVALKIKS